MSKEFTRGARYVVLKNADIMQCLTVNELIQLRYIQARVGEHRAKLGKPRLDCVVVESDWPEYEPTWNAIEMRMTGSLKESAVQTATRIMNIELIRERDDLRAENDELRKALAQKVTSETMLRDLSVGNGSINAAFEGGAVYLLVDSLSTQFVESGAHNYIEMQFHSEATGPLLLTLQRVNGKTPHQLRAEAEKERDDLRIALRHEADCVEAAAAKIEALGAKIVEMEQQEPVAEIVSFGSSDLKEVAWKKGKMPALGSNLYALPGTHALLRVPDAVIAALDNLDDYMSRIEGNDHGACNHINLIRRYLVDATEVGENK